MSRFKLWWWLGGTSNPYLAPYWHSMKITSDWLYTKGQDLSAVHGNICNIIRFQTQNLQSLNNSKIIYLWKQPICLVACRANYTSYIIIKSWQVRLFFVLILMMMVIGLTSLISQLNAINFYLFLLNHWDSGQV